MNPTELRALAEMLEHECALRLIAGGKNHEEAQACEQAADYLRQCAEQRPDGWQLVPVEPTPAMKSAGGHVNSEWLNDDAPLYESRYAMSMDGVWSAMLAAAPAAPQAEQITRIERRAGGDSSTANMGVQEVMARAEPKRDPHWIDPKFSEWWASDKADEHADNPFQADSAAAWAYAGWMAARRAEPKRPAEALETGDSDADRCRSSEMPSSKATSAASPERPVLNREDAAAQVAAGSGEQRDPCIGNDPACPCQDGDACHYKDTPTTKAWPIPKREQFPGDTLERAIDDYVADYELNDGEVFRAPSDEDRFMLKDAILGLLVDPEWEREWSEHIAMLAQREPLSDSEIEGLWEAASSTTDNDFDIHEFARLIESAHEIGVDEP